MTFLNSTEWLNRPLINSRNSLLHLNAISSVLKATNGIF